VSKREHNSTWTALGTHLQRTTAHAFLSRRYHPGRFEKPDEAVVETREAVMESSNMIRILIADDHPILRRGLAEVISGQQGMRVVAEAATGTEVLELYAEHRPDIALIDVRLPDTQGIGLIDELRSRFPGARIIVLTTATGDVQIVRALRAGALSYLSKSVARPELIETIRKVARGQKHIPPQVAAEMAEHAMDEALSMREITVLQHASNGNSNKIIADTLRLSEHTIKTHFKNILGKLQANDRTHAVMIALRRGYLELPNAQ